MTSPHSYTGQKRLHQIFNKISIIPEGRAVVDFIRNNNIAVTFDKKNTNYAAGGWNIPAINGNKYIYENFNIDCNSKLSDNNLSQAIIHEAQHIRHHMNKLGNPDFWPSIEDHCLLRRIQEADAQTVTTKLVYMLREAGDSGPYDATMNTIYAPMCEIFAKACTRNVGNLHNGKAQRLAFDEWFKDTGNMRFYDRNTVLHHIPYLQARLWENPSHNIRLGHLEETWLRKIGGLSDINYMDLQGHPKITSRKYRRHIKDNIRLFPPMP